MDRASRLGCTVFTDWLPANRYFMPVRKKKRRLQMCTYKCPVCKDDGYVVVMGLLGCPAYERLCPECQGDPDSLVSITDLKNEIIEIIKEE